MPGCIAAKRFALNLDIYKQPFTFFMPDEKPMYRTLLGTFLSIFTIVIVLFTGIYKFYLLTKLEQYKIQTTTQE